MGQELGQKYCISGFPDLGHCAVVISENVLVLRGSGGSEIMCWRPWLQAYPEAGYKATFLGEPR